MSDYTPEYFSYLNHAQHLIETALESIAHSDSRTDYVKTCSIMLGDCYNDVYILIHHHNALIDDEHRTHYVFRTFHRLNSVRFVALLDHDPIGGYLQQAARRVQHYLTAAADLASMHDHEETFKRMKFETGARDLLDSIRTSGTENL